MHDFRLCARAGDLATFEECLLAAAAAAKEAAGVSVLQASITNPVILNSKSSIHPPPCLAHSELIQIKQLQWPHAGAFP